MVPILIYITWSAIGVVSLIVVEELGVDLLAEIDIGNLGVLLFGQTEGSETFLESGNSHSYFFLHLSFGEAFSKYDDVFDWHLVDAIEAFYRLLHTFTQVFEDVRANFCQWCVFSECVVVGGYKAEEVQVCLKVEAAYHSGIVSKRQLVDRPRFTANF
jgi:hypothetical protein